VAKPGLDGHDRGAQVVARSLAEAGFDVIYTGIRQTPEMIVAAALQEDVDCIGLSVLSGAHIEYAQAILEQLRAAGAGHVALLVGGIVPDDDVQPLRNLGVHAVFGPGSDTSAIAAAIEEACGARPIVEVRR
jgi:methylmalonyl-CoA mutase C-terminal domain/subunit